MTYLPNTLSEDDSNTNTVHPLSHGPTLHRTLFQVQEPHHHPLLHARNRRMAGRSADQDAQPTGSRKPLPALLQSPQRLISREKRNIIPRIFAYSVTRLLPLVYDIRHVSRSKPSRGQSSIGNKGMALTVVPSLFQRHLIKRFQ